MTLSAKRIAAGRVAAGVGNELVYTVPVGRRAIIRDTLVEAGGTPQTIIVFVGIAAQAGVPGVNIMREVGMANAEVRRQTDTFIVCEAGDTVNINGGGLQVDYIISGHEFVLP